MKKLKLLSLAILLLSVAAFGYCKAEQIRTDDEAPVIQMDAETIEVSVEDGEEALLDGVTATDDVDGDVSASLIVDTISDFSDDGTRYVTIAAFDSSNNVGKATRELHYTDYESPRYEFIEPMRFTTGDSDYLENVSVNDCLDGDISSSARFTDNTSITVDEAGEYQVELQVRNSAGDTVYLPFTLEVLDSSDYGTQPQILLEKYVLYVKKGEKPDYTGNLDSVTVGATEYKIVDGSKWSDSSVGRDRFKVDDGNVDYDTPGTYEATYSLTLSGNTSSEDVKGTVRAVVVVEE